jgi:paraquat-inducible protein B
MAERTDSDNFPQATLVPSKRRRISIVWIVPLFAAVVAIGIDIQRIMAYAKKVLSRIGARGVDAATRIVGFLSRRWGWA